MRSIPPRGKSPGSRPRSGLAVRRWLSAWGRTAPGKLRRHPLHLSSFGPVVWRYRGIRKDWLRKRKYPARPSRRRTIGLRTVLTVETAVFDGDIFQASFEGSALPLWTADSRVLR